jgi:DNA adenine methylase
MMAKLSHITPILKWAGGKTRLAGQISAFFPDKFDRYVEPFLGGAAIFLTLSPGTKSLLSDANDELINLYRVVRDRPERLIDKLEEYRERYSEEFYYFLRNTVPKGVVAQAARTIFLNKTCFNGLYRLNKQGVFNVSFGHRRKCPELYNRDNIIEVSRRLGSVELKVSDFEDIMERTGDGDLVYCDPPYVPISSTATFTKYSE